MDGRQARGRVLAQAQGDRIKHIEGDLWFVPSSQGSGGYLVDRSARRCGCADSADPCKHLVAVEIVRAGLASAPAAATESKALAPSLPATAPAKPAPLPKGDLTVEEQRNVRVVLRFLRTRLGGWSPLGKVLRFAPKTLEDLAYTRPPGASLAIRLARVAGAPVDDVLNGRFPPTCSTCGQRMPARGATPDGAQAGKEAP